MRTTLHGTTGTPVVLLAGGASSTHGFFPGLIDALPGARVVELDRPGTGLAVRDGEATLATGSAAVASVVRDLGAAAVLVGQSLGGLLAVQVAADHPELVAGLVLLDPTPYDLPEMVPTLRRVFTLFGAPGRLPVVGRRLDQLLWKVLGMGGHVAPEAQSGRDVMFQSATLDDTARAVAHLDDEMRALAPRVRALDVPTVLLTADRKPGHKVRQSHERLAAALGARIVAPPSAVHADHLRDPRGFNDLVASVVAEVSARPARAPS